MKFAIVELNREIRVHAQIYELLAYGQHIEHCKFIFGYSLGALSFAVMFLMYRVW